MAHPPPPLEILAALSELYGPPRPPVPTEPFELILWENVAYLVGDAKRERAFCALVERVGTEPTQILAASREELLEIAVLGGPMASRRVDKLRRCAEIAAGEFDGDLDAATRESLRQAVKSLRKFPGIGAPGAEKVLLLSRRHKLLPLDSNGLRVLLRLGFGEEKKSYAATYSAVQSAVREGIPEEFDVRIAAYGWLRLHGQERCRRSAPLCDSCPLQPGCRFYASGRPAA